MMRPANRAARHRRQLRREAARLVLENPHDASLDLGDLAPDARAEVQAMLSLTLSLDELSASAWATVPTPEAAGAGVLDVKRAARTRKRVWATAAVGACLAAAFIIGAVSHPFLGRTPRHAPAVTGTVTLKPLPGSSRSATAVAYMSRPNRMVVRVRGLPRSAPGTFYELWLMTSNTDLVPVASFKIGSSGAAKLALVLPDSPTRYRYLDVSLQRVRSGTQISPDSVLRGRLRS